MTHGSVSYRINNVPPPFAGALACVAAKKKTPSRGGLHKESWTVVMLLYGTRRLAPARSVKQIKQYQCQNSCITNPTDLFDFLVWC